MDKIKISDFKNATKETAKEKPGIIWSWVPVKQTRDDPFDRVITTYGVNQFTPVNNILDYLKNSEEPSRHVYYTDSFEDAEELVRLGIITS